MTNKEDADTVEDCNPRMAALLAVHLVSQVLDEAYIIANAAKDSGQSWRQLSILKSFKNSLVESDEDVTFDESKSECEINENKMDMSTVATSTPQRVAARVSSDEGEASILTINDSTFIGQGDEDVELHQHDLENSTSMFINNLFDMSDVERIVICEDTDAIQGTSESNELLADAMNKIMESYVANTLIPLETFPNVTIIEGSGAADLSLTHSSDYSLLADAFIADISRDVAFYIDDDNLREKRDDGEGDAPAAIEEIIDMQANILVVSEQMDRITENVIQNNDFELYENAYATLNRDYEQGSVEEVFPILQDPKGMALQEVELITANTSDYDVSHPNPKNAEKSKNALLSASGVSGRKSNLARRCRVQGARLLACLRGWWRRKTPGKRKEAGFPVLGMCPLSPDARRRASSLLDNRLLRSPSPSRPIVWKFNTVNESMVNSNRWKEYTFENKPEDCDQF